MNTKQTTLFAFLFALFLASAFSVSAQTTAFTYQGKLNNDAAPVNGSYQFQFKLYDAASGGNQIGQTLIDVPATVSDGVFAVSLDFGATGFDGESRYLEIGVRPAGSPDPYTILNPRHSVASVPYAIKSLNAEQANTANMATTANNTTNLGGVPADQYVQTDDSRMSDARQPLAGSTNYIQNTQNQQSNSNFNISGEGKANKFNAATGYHINNNRVLSVAGTDNAFVGASAGAATTGGYNAFVGAESGKTNTTGFNNSFLGAYSGRGNTIGSNNTFVGANAGLSNDTGSSNSFFGSASGFSNTNGASNSFFGSSSGQNNTTGNNNSFFGRSAGKSVTNATNNAFFGAFAGENSTTGGNAFFGSLAGQKNNTGYGNTFLGYLTGKDSIGGNNNTFVGNQAGHTFWNGSNNTALGYQASVADNLTNATAIGANAVATQSNTVVLGTTTTSVQVPGNFGVSKNAVFSQNLSVNDTISAPRLSVFGNMFKVDPTAATQKIQFNEKTFMNKGLVIEDISNVGGELEVKGSAYIDYAKIDTLMIGSMKNFGTTSDNYVCTRFHQGMNSYYLIECDSQYLQDNVQSYTGGLDLVRRLRPVSFNLKSNGEASLGFVAKEVNELEPRFTTLNKDNEVSGVKYQLITVSLVSAIQQQQEQIKRQQEQIEALKALVCASNKDNAVCRQ